MFFAYAVEFRHKFLRSRLHIDFVVFIISSHFRLSHHVAASDARAVGHI